MNIGVLNGQRTIFEKIEEPVVFESASDEELPPIPVDSIEETMDELFGSLSQKKFYRINRGQIVAKSSIQKMDPYFNHRVKLSVSNPRDQEFIVSRSKTGDFKKWMNT